MVKKGEKSMKKRTTGEKIFTVFNTLFLIIFAFTTLYPFIYTLSKSLSTQAAVMQDVYFLYPKEITFAAYRRVLTGKQLYVTYGNTLFRTIVGTTLTLLVTSMYAYPLSRKYMPNRKFFMMFTSFTMLFSGGTIPLYIVIRNLNLLNNRWVYILPMLVGAYNVIIIRSFFMSIPDSLVESAKIDGASEFTILFKIMLPLSKAVLATVALWAAVGHWNSWFDSMLYIDDKEKQVVQLYLQQIVQKGSTNELGDGLSDDLNTQTADTIKSATIMVTVLPILFVYPFVQKYFVTGVMLGSVKG